MNGCRWLTCALLAAFLVPTTLAAQGERQWRVDVTGGAQLYPEGSALNMGGSVGIEAMYGLTSRLSVGPMMDYVRTDSDGSFFVAALDFGADSTRIFEVGQRVSVLHVGGLARFDVSPDAEFNPYVMGGGGLYTMYLETQANNGPSRFTNPMFQAGAGIRYNVSEATGLKLEVRDVIYTDYDRERLNPIRAPNRNCQPNGNCRFPDAERSDTPENNDLIHNFRVSLGLTYVPGAGG